MVLDPEGGQNWAQSKASEKSSELSWLDKWDQSDASQTPDRRHSALAILSSRAVMRNGRFARQHSKYRLVLKASAPKRGASPSVTIVLH